MLRILIILVSASDILIGIGTQTDVMHLYIADSFQFRIKLLVFSHAIFKCNYVRNELYCKHYILKVALCNVVQYVKERRGYMKSIKSQEVMSKSGVCFFVVAIVS